MLNFTVEVDIDRNRDDVVALMHPDNMIKWAPNFVGMKHLSGPLWEEGSKYELNFKYGNANFKIIETFVTRRLPESFSCIFEETNSFQASNNRLEVLSDSKTRWVSEQSLKGTNVFTALMVRCLPWMFKKKVKESMLSFKKFAETN